jgi:hypothetical protein
LKNLKLSDTSPPPSPFLEAGTPPAPIAASSGPEECRLCANETDQAIDIFGKEGCRRGLPEKTRLCLPILVRILRKISKFIHQPTKKLIAQKYYKKSQMQFGVNIEKYI